MTTLAALVLLVVAACAAPAAVVLAEWVRTVPGLFNLRPDIAFIPGGYRSFYLIVAATALVVALPVAWRRIVRAEFRLSKYVLTFLGILIFWKVLDVTVLSGAAPGGIGGGDTMSNVVLSLLVFAYAALAGAVFWLIAVLPHSRIAAREISGGQT